jgi:hypothetical protein
VLVAAALTLSGCSSDADKVNELQNRLAAKENETADLQRQMTALKQQISSPPPEQHGDTTAAGQGDGHFTVMPTKARPGEPVAVYTELAKGTVRLAKKDGLQTVASWPGPAARQIGVYTLPQDLAPGEYYVTFSGEGGTAGEALITVEKGQ